MRKKLFISRTYTENEIETFSVVTIFIEDFTQVSEVKLLGCKPLDTRNKST